jgi:hypothetical protein
MRSPPVLVNSRAVNLREPIRNPGSISGKILKIESTLKTV